MAAHSNHSKLPPYQYQPLEFTTPPNPKWQWGDRVDSTPEGKEWLAGIQGGWKTYDPDQLNVGEVLSICISSVVPRPIGFISTTSKDGIDNIAPYAYFTVVSHEPLILCFVSEMQTRGMKDSPRNVAETGEFVVNIPSDVWAIQAHAAAVSSPPDQEEWGFSGLTKEPSQLVRPPRVRESGVSFECKLWHTLPIMNPKINELSSNVIFGEVKRIHIRKDMLVCSPNNQLPQVDPKVLRPLARLGDLSYASLGSMFRLPTTTWEWSDASEQALEGAKRRAEREHGSTAGGSQN